MELLGQRIKLRRELKGYNLKEFGKLINSSASFVSQIENGKATPSIFTLKKIAEVLDTTVSDLLGEFDNVKLNPFVSYENKKFVQKYPQGTTLYLLSNHSENKKLEPYLVKCPAGVTCKDFLKGFILDQCFIFVIEGNFEITLKNNQKYILKSKDSFYTNTKDIFHITNVGKNMGEFLVIFSHSNIN